MTMITTNPALEIAGKTRAVLTVLRRIAAGVTAATRPQMRRHFYVHHDAARLERARRDVHNFWTMGR